MSAGIIPIKRIQPPLAMVVVEVSTWCNLQCPGCTRTIGLEQGTWENRHMGMETFRKVIGNLPRAQQIVLHGVGEPTLNPHYLDFIRHARQSGKFEKIVCITNGLTRGLDYFDQMLAAGMNSFTVSVDSLTQTIADRTRTGTRVTKLRERLRAFAARRLPFAVNMVASRLNVDDIAHTLAQLDEIGVDSVHLQRFIDFDDQSVTLNDADITALVSQLEHLQSELRHTRLHYPGLLGPAQGSNAALCTSPWREPAVTIDGYLTPCCVKLAPGPLQRLDLTRHTFADLQATEVYGRFLRDYATQAPDFCEGCFNNRRPADARPLVSVTMVTYNHAGFVREALDSLLAQSYSPLEIVISDDASTDATARIVEERLARYQGPHYVRFLRQSVNLGARGRNNFQAAYGEARGEFIVWFCGDDIMSPTQVERMVDTWQREKVSLVTVNAMYIDELSRPTGRVHRADGALPCIDVDSLARNGANDCCFGAGMGFGREVVDTFGFDAVTPPPEFAPDVIFPFYAGLLDGCAFIPEPLLSYRQHGAQTSASLQLENESSTQGRARIEGAIFSGHARIAAYLQTVLGHYAQIHPDRFGPAATRLLPLLDEQRISMLTRLDALEGQSMPTLSGQSEGVADEPPPSQASLVAETLNLLRTNDLMRAAQTCSAALEIYPEAGPFWFMMALIMRSVGDLDCAAQMLDSALRCDPENAEYLNELASLRPAPRGAIVAPATHATSDTPDPLDLLTVVPRVTVYLVDVSDECNLRCVYCHQSQPGYEGRPMAPDVLDTLQQMVLHHPPVSQAFLSSGGETTTLANWHAVVGRFVDMGVPCALISNFARPFNEEEIATLATLQEILISIDTIDAELTKRIRKKSDVRTILFNMQRIRAHCVTRARAAPRFVWNVVGHDIALHNLPSLAAAAAVYRPDQVTISPMKPIPGLQIKEVRAIEDLDSEARRPCAQALTQALQILDANRIPHAVNEQLKRMLGLQAGQPQVDLTPGMTRDCLMPWELFLTHSNGTVKPCCNAEGITIGRIIPGTDPFETVFNGPQMRAWRRTMLTGELNEACRQCTAYAATTPKHLARRVRALIGQTCVDTAPAAVPVTLVP